MSELNREQIIKALECCIKNQCENCCQCGNWHEQWNCMTFLMKNAVALIKELTEENEKLHASYTELTLKCASLTEENERLRGFNSAKCEDCAGCTSWKCDCANIEAQAKADTVRKMQERLKNAICDNTYPDFNRDGKPVNVWKATTGYDLIDQIAKEMLVCL